MNASSSGVVLARRPSALATAAPTAASVTAASKLAPRQRLSHRARTTTCCGNDMRQRGHGSSLTAGAGRRIALRPTRPDARRMDFTLTDEQRALKQMAREFALKEFPAYSKESDDQEKFPEGPMKKAAE